MVNLDPHFCEKKLIPVRKDKEKYARTDTVACGFAQCFRIQRQRQRDRGCKGCMNNVQYKLTTKMTTTRAGTSQERS
jgi:hypothetical protein